MFVISLFEPAAFQKIGQQYLVKSFVYICLNEVCLQIVALSFYLCYQLLHLLGVMFFELKRGGFDLLSCFHVDKPSGRVVKVQFYLFVFVAYMKQNNFVFVVSEVLKSIGEAVCVIDNVHKVGKYYNEASLMNTFCNLVKSFRNVCVAVILCFLR